MNHTDFHGIGAQEEYTTLPSKYVCEDICGKAGEEGTQSTSLEWMELEPVLTNEPRLPYLGSQWVTDEQASDIRLKSIFMRIFATVNPDCGTTPRDFADPALLSAIETYVDGGSGGPNTLDIDRLSKELEEFADQSGIDLDSMLQAASAHFTSPTIGTRSQSVTDEDIEALIEDDELHLND